MKYEECDNSRVYTTSAFNAISKVCVQEWDGVDLESYRFFCERYDCLENLTEDYFSLVTGLPNMNAIGIKSPIYDLRGAFCGENDVMINVKSARIRGLGPEWRRYSGIHIHGHESKLIRIEDNHAYRLILIIDDMLDKTYIMLISNEFKKAIAFRRPLERAFRRSSRSDYYVYKEVGIKELEDIVGMKLMIEKMWFMLKEREVLIPWF